MTTMLERLAQQADSEPSGTSGKKSPVSADIDGKLAEGPSVDPNTLSAQAQQQNSIRTQTANARMTDTDEPVALPADLAGRVFHHDQSLPKTRKVSDRPEEAESASSSNKPSTIPGEATNIRIGGGAPSVTSKASPPPRNGRDNTPGENQLAADGLKRGFSKDKQKRSVAPTDAQLEGGCGPAMPRGSGGEQTKAAIGPVAHSGSSNSIKRQNWRGLQPVRSRDRPNLKLSMASGGWRDPAEATSSACWKNGQSRQMSPKLFITLPSPARPPKVRSAMTP